MTTTNHRIWPGPECLKTRELQPGDRVVLLAFANGTNGLTLNPMMRRDVGKAATVERLTCGSVLLDQRGNQVPWYWPSTAVMRIADYQRTRGIALEHVRASARMRRFVVWLLSYSACAERAALRKGLSPESAVRSGSLYELQWLATRVLHSRWREAFREPVNVEAELLALLASPEWLSLPWQRESEEVGRGR